MQAFARLASSLLVASHPHHQSYHHQSHHHRHEQQPCLRLRAGFVCSVAVAVISAIAALFARYHRHQNHQKSYLQHLRRAPSQQRKQQRA
jgi:zinc transporter ZupT